MRVLANHGDHELEAQVTREGDTITVKIGEQEHRFDVAEAGGGRVVLTAGARSHVVEIDTAEIHLDGRPFDLSVRKAPPKVEGAMRGAGGAGGAVKVKPPMPGKIVKVSVAAGDHVQAGDVLVILEAMKMQNEIVAPSEGTIKSIEVQEGENIDSKRVICEIE